MRQQVGRQKVGPTIVGGLGDQLSTVHHSDVSVGSARRVGLQPLDLLYHLKTRGDVAKDDVDAKEQVKRPVLIQIISLFVRFQGKSADGLTEPL